MRLSHSVISSDYLFTTCMFSTFTVEKVNKTNSAIRGWSSCHLSVVTFLWWRFTDPHPVVCMCHTTLETVRGQQKNCYRNAIQTADTTQDTGVPQSDVLPAITLVWARSEGSSSPFDHQQNCNLGPVVHQVKTDLPGFCLLWPGIREVRAWERVNSMSPCWKIK